MLGGVTLTAGIAIAGVVALVALWWYRSTGSTRKTSRKASSSGQRIAAGAGAAGVGVVSFAVGSLQGLSDALSNLGDVLILEAPGFVTQAATVVLGYATLDGMITLSPFAWGIVAGGLLLVGLMLK